MANTCHNTELYKLGNFNGGYIVWEYAQPFRSGFVEQIDWLQEIDMPTKFQGMTWIDFIG
jgi:hypothetical protein